MAKAKAKRPPKTPKEKAFINEYLKTGNATESASRVYDTKSRDVARNIGSQNVAKLSFSQIFDNQGLTDQTLINSLAEATKATKFSYSKETPDWSIRIKAIELCLKLKGSFSLSEAQAEERLEKIKSNSEEDIWQNSLTDKQRELEKYVYHIQSVYELTNEQRKKAVVQMQKIIDKEDNQKHASS